MIKNKLKWHFIRKAQRLSMEANKEKDDKKAIKLIKKSIKYLYYSSRFSTEDERQFLSKELRRVAEKHMDRD